MEPVSLPETPAAGSSYPPARTGWTVVFILTAAYVVSFLDRQILALLIQPIKRDLGLSDTAISLLLGLACAIGGVLGAALLAYNLEHFRAAMIEAEGWDQTP